MTENICGAARQFCIRDPESTLRQKNISAERKSRVRKMCEIIKLLFLLDPVYSEKAKNVSTEKKNIKINEKYLCSKKKKILRLKNISAEKLNNLKMCGMTNSFFRDFEMPKNIVRKTYRVWQKCFILEIPKVL